MMKQADRATLVAAAMLSSTPGLAQERVVSIRDDADQTQLVLTMCMDEAARTHKDLSGEQRVDASLRDCADHLQSWASLSRTAYGESLWQANYRIWREDQTRRNTPPPAGMAWRTAQVRLTGTAAVPPWNAGRASADAFLETYAVDDDLCLRVLPNDFPRGGALTLNRGAAGVNGPVVFQSS